MSDILLKRVVDLVTQNEIDDSVYTIIDSVTDAVKKYPVGKFIGSVAPIFDSGTNYAKGDYCNYNGQIYQFTADHAGLWTGEDAETVVMTDKFDDIADALTATLIPSTASGSIASFPDGADLPVKGLSVGIEPVQDLHGYDSPWPAGGGKNKVDMSTVEKGGYYDGSGTWIPDNGVATTDLIPVKAGTTYVSSLFDGTKAYLNNCVATLWDDENTCTGQITTASFTTGSNTRFVRIRNFSGQGSYITADNFLFQLEEGSTHTAFAPYSNFCPITGWTGVNVVRCGKNFVNPALYQFTERTLNGLTYTVQSDGTIKVNGTSTQIGGPQLTNRFLLPAGTYVRKETTEIGVSCAYRYAFQKTGGSTYVLPNPFVSTGKEWVYVNVYCSQIKEYDNVTLYPQLELGSTATSYEPYTATTIHINWQSEAGTVYGGTLDVTSGVLRVNRAAITFDGSSDEQWTKYGSGSASAYSMRISVPNFKFVQSTVTAWSNYLPSIDNGQTWGNYDVFLSMSAVGPATGIRTITSVDDWRTYLASNPLEVLYELAEPLTIQLTPSTLRTLYGVNNIWADTGDVSVDYYADTKLYIEKLTAPTEDDMVANSNIQSGKYFMVGNSLYLSTAVIAQGDRIVPGTNCTLTNLAAALNALNS